MKIGFDAKRLFHNQTGLGNYSRTLVKNLQTFYSNNDYHLYSPSRGKKYPFFSNKNYTIHQAKGLFPPLWRSLGIKNELQKNKLAIYHGLSHELPFGLPNTKIKTVVTIHDLIFKILPHTYPFIDRQIYDFKFKSACQNADIIIAISENTKRDIIQYYGIDSNKIKVVYQACQTIFYTQSRSEALLKKYNLPKAFILTVGALGKRKNLKLLLDAQQLLPKDLQIPIVLVDQGKLPSFLEKKVQKMIAKKQLIWLKDLHNTEALKALYQKATILVYPSLYEGFGLPIVEALLSQTPVITAQNSSLQEAGGLDSIYINGTSTEELKSALERVLEGEELQKKMIKNGLAYAQSKFNPKKLSQQLMAIYEQIL